MSTITALKPQKRTQERVNVYLDGKFAFGLALAAAQPLRIGQILTDSDIERLQGEDTVEKAKQSALRYLSYRPRSQTEVERNLRKKKYEDPVIAQVVSYLTEVALLDDDAFARYWVEQRETFKPRSQIALRQELAQKGVGREAIEKALADVDETAAARRAAEKRVHRWANLPQDEFRLKLGRFLQRRGFHYGIIRDITDQLWHSLERADDENQR